MDHWEAGFREKSARRARQRDYRMVGVYVAMGAALLAVVWLAIAAVNALIG